MPLQPLALFVLFSERTGTICATIDQFHGGRPEYSLNLFLSRLEPYMSFQRAQPAVTANIRHFPQ